MRALIFFCAVVLALGLALPVTADGPQVYTVQPGDTLSGIASRYGTTADAIARLNDLLDQDQLRVGQKLSIVSVDESRLGADIPATALVGPVRGIQPQPAHRVAPGETLSEIAAQYHTSVEALVELNELSSASLLSVGQLLVLPTPPVAPKTAGLPVGRTVDYAVQPEDTLLEVSLRYGLDMRSVSLVNGLPASSWVWPGQKVTLPVDWQVQGAPKPALSKRIVVDVSEQRVYAWEGQHLRWTFVGSTGLPGYGTRRGTFAVKTKLPMAVSRALNLDMPYWLGIYDAGSTENGFHGLPVNRTTKVRLWGGLIGRPVSYGCIVLRDNDMAVLYNWTPLGTVVVIRD